MSIHDLDADGYAAGKFNRSADKLDFSGLAVFGQGGGAALAFYFVEHFAKARIPFQEKIFNVAIFKMFDDSGDLAVSFAKIVCLYHRGFNWSVLVIGGEFIIKSCKK